MVKVKRTKLLGLDDEALYHEHFDSIRLGLRTDHCTAGSLTLE